MTSEHDQSRPPPNPFYFDEPTIVSFSGGRTSGLMLWSILQAHGGSLPESVKVCFANTGKEREETLDFVQACASNWQTQIVWLEHDPTESLQIQHCGPQHRESKRKTIRGSD